MDAIVSRDIMEVLGMDIGCILSEYRMFDRLEWYNLYRWRAFGYTKKCIYMYIHRPTGVANIHPSRSLLASLSTNLSGSKKRGENMESILNTFMLQIPDIGLHVFCGRCLSQHVQLKRTYSQEFIAFIFSPVAS